MDLGIRLTADATVADDLLRRDPPALSEAADLMAAAGNLTKRFEAIATQVGQAHRSQMDETQLEQLRAAVRQLGTVAQTLAELPATLDPSHPRRPDWPDPAPTSWRSDPEFP